MAQSFLFTLSSLLVMLSNLLITQHALSLVVHADSRYCAACHQTIRCPPSCPRINDAKARHLCSITCGKRCRAVCKLNGCLKAGAVCNDPRFVGRDGSFFYFHGKANEDFCMVTDENVHINGHFIGKRVAGRSRDFTWVQAIGLLYGRHRVSVSASRVTIWDDTIEHLEVTYDGASISLPTYIGEKWESPLGELVIVRSEDLNSLELHVANLLKVSTNATYVNEQDSNIHGYGINGHDCFAHLDIHFTFFNLSRHVNGVLGQTYRPDYRNLFMMRNIPMPTMGGYKKFKSSSLFSTDCQVSHFNGFSSPSTWTPFNARSKME